MGQEVSTTICNTGLCDEIEKNKLFQTNESDYLNMDKVFITFILDFQYRKFIKSVF
jgi:hypothetical protein